MLFMKIFTLTVLLALLSGCGAYRQLLEENARLARQPAHIEQQMIIHEMNVRLAQ